MSQCVAVCDDSVFVVKFEGGKQGIFGSVLQCAAVCCSVLQSVVECCSVLQCAAVC